MSEVAAFAGGVASVLLVQWSSRVRLARREAKTFARAPRKKHKGHDGWPDGS